MTQGFEPLTVARALGLKVDESEDVAFRFCGVVLFDRDGGCEFAERSVVGRDADGTVDRNRGGSPVAIGHMQTGEFQRGLRRCQGAIRQPFEVRLRLRWISGKNGQTRCLAALSPYAGVLGALKIERL